ncbi:TetR/AcrR family transcriptional regulator [Sphingorhabdus lacus]|uniref:TetR/AcrR family transcriptional regulator n=1 Tax=Sphingorhabdus lacus TaxID=392610 RepID=A0A6I6L5U4_9SPHN|nr:TetR/AcrR family transcriptional regulator [Sphingorhabdus lacus]
MPLRPAHRLPYTKTVKKPDSRRQDIIQRLTDHVLAEGLSASSLRPLAKAAGTSDRMLLYYFSDKAEIITAVLEEISARLVLKLGDRVAPELLPVDVLRRQFAAILFVDELWPYMRIWLEVASRAAMGDAYFRGVGEQIGRGFYEWGKAQLLSESEEQRDVDAARLLVTIEGMLLLKSLGLDDINAKAV